MSYYYDTKYLPLLWWDDIVVVVTIGTVTVVVEPLALSKSGNKFKKVKTKSQV